MTGFEGVDFDDVDARSRDPFVSATVGVRERMLSSTTIGFAERLPLPSSMDSPLSDKGSYPVSVLELDCGVTCGCLPFCAETVAGLCGDGGTCLRGCNTMSLSSSELTSVCSSSPYFDL